MLLYIFENIGIVAFMKKTFLLCILLIWAITGCTATSFQSDTPHPTVSLPGENSLMPASSFTPFTTPIPSPTAIIPDSGWTHLQPGLEQRTLNLIGPQNTVTESILILRVDPETFSFEVHHQTNPLSLEEWAEQTNADIVLNGGYYLIENETYYPTGLVISNSEPFGTSYGEFAGMFTVSNGYADLRWLAQVPYDPSEQFDFALQSFPLLVKPGGQLGFSAEFEDNLTARRTVLAKDQSGNILFILTQKRYFTLHTLSMFLTGSDLDLDIAVNLDGGPSTGLFIREPYFKIPAATLLPFVLTIHAK
jgi:hypothetical protein